MAPLDPASKSLVMNRVKDFCSGSVVLVRVIVDFVFTFGWLHQSNVFPMTHDAGYISY